MDVDVVVIGGGATGCGIAWDLTLRGCAVTLVEKSDIAGGTSGRFHGLLHSGARYAVSEPPTAEECRRENVILRRVAPSALDDIGGLYVLGDGDDEHFPDRWVDGCRRAGIPVEEIPIDDARRAEPGLSAGLKRAFRVPDAVCRSLALCASLRRSAESRGARFLTFHGLDAFHRRGADVEGVQVTDVRTGSRVDIGCRMVVNAAGPWGGHVAGLAGIPLRMKLVRGAMLAFEGRLVNTVVSCLQAPDEGDIVLPRGRVSIAGTTAVTTDDPGDRRVDDAEVARVRRRVARFLPRVAEARLVHAWSAVRPLYDHDGRGKGDADLWNLSREYTVIDHGSADGVERLVSVVGGKLTTFRLMAEEASDLVCRRLGVAQKCRTADTPLE